MNKPAGSEADSEAPDSEPLIQNPKQDEGYEN
jgi:hypothetical protein